jgi:hypothetical protein
MRNKGGDGGGFQIRAEKSRQIFNLVRRQIAISFDFFGGNTFKNGDDETSKFYFFVNSIRFILKAVKVTCVNPSEKFMQFRRYS